jgi:hypothetical protein
MFQNKDRVLTVSGKLVLKRMQANDPNLEMTGEEELNQQMLLTWP